MYDLKKLSQRERFESGSNISTNYSNYSDFEFNRIERQKKREQEVLQKIQKIWIEMEDVKREIAIQHPVEEQESESSSLDSCVSISGSLGLSLKEEGTPFFMAHQEIQERQSIQQIEAQIQAKVDAAISCQPRI